MSLTETTQIPLNFSAFPFELTDGITSKTTSFNNIKGDKGTLVMFICNHCPYVIHVIEELVNIGNEYLPKGIGFVAINSNDAVNYPDDSPEKMKDFSSKYKLPFPYLFDQTQQVAKEYDAACTPDFALFDANNLCVYRGRMDASRPRMEIPIPVTGADLRKALDYVVADKEIDYPQLPSAGCNIKWKR